MQYPRRHLYVFAHQLLPSLAFHDPKQLLAILQGPKAPDFLSTAWNEISEELEPKDRTEFPELAYSMHRCGNFIIYVIQFPEPARVAEPYYAAFAFGPLPEDPERPPEVVPIRYFLLEQGVAFAGWTARRVMAEYIRDSHIVYGEGPKPDTDAFLGAIRRLLAVPMARLDP